MTSKLLQIKPLIATNDLVAMSIGDKLVRALHLKKDALRTGYFSLEGRSMTTATIARHLFAVFEQHHFSLDNELIGDTIAEQCNLSTIYDKRHFATIDGPKTAVELATAIAEIMLYEAKKLPIDEYFRLRDQDALFLAGNELDWVSDIGEARRYSFAEIGKEAEALGDGERWEHLSVLAD